MTIIFARIPNHVQIIIVSLFLGIFLIYSSAATLALEHTEIIASNDDILVIVWVLRPLDRILAYAMLIIGTLVLIIASLSCFRKWKRKVR